MTLDDVLAQASHEAVARITVLWPDGTVRRVFDVDQRVLTGGSVTAEWRRDVRRSASLDLVNDAAGTLTPALSDDLFAQGSIVSIERGAVVDGSPTYAQLMTGFVTLGTASYPEATISLAVEGYMSALGQPHGTGEQLIAGTFLVDALHALFDPVLPSVTWVIEAGAEELALGADIPVLPTDSRLDVGLKIARDLGAEVFDDRYGRIVVRVRQGPTTQPTVRVMTDPLSVQRTMGRAPINAQPVTGTVGDREPVYVLVEVDDPSSPVHRDRIGLRMAPMIATDTTDDPDTLRAMGRSWLAARAMAQDSVSVSSLPDHLDLDAGDVVERVNATTGTSGRYAVDSITYPIGQGTITTTETSVVPIFLADET